MQSGIYLIEFSSGRYYIGKSENIPKRWKQHNDNFIKGKHTKKMQNEYEAYGPPEYRVLINAHRDHIDLLEASLIYKNQGPDCLNGTIPDAPDPDEDRILEKYGEDLLYSTAAHIQLLHDYEDKLNKAYEDISKLKAKGIKLPEEWEDELFGEGYTSGLSKAHNYTRKISLWDRIFNWDRVSTEILGL